jgi:hypothetical protein
MKKFGFNFQMRNEPFLIVIYHSSQVKDAMNAASVCKLRNGVGNWQLKNRRRCHSLKGSHSIGDGRIFLKTRRGASFNKDLSNEPNFDQIHLAGQYL